VLPQRVAGANIGLQFAGPKHYMISQDITLSYMSNFRMFYHPLNRSQSYSVCTLLEKISGTIFQTAVILEPFDLGP